mgnify:CR=1 FL=1
MSEKIVRLGEFEVNLEELSKFLVNAKKRNYASKEKKIREVDGSKTFIFQDGNFYYTDNYAGSLQAQGNEIVRCQRKDGQRIWSMNRFGGLLSKYWKNGFSEEIYPFLKESLVGVTSKRPFRGSEMYEDKKLGLKYISLVEGDITRFEGKEKIICKRTGYIVFSQNFMGGLVIPRN